MVVTFNVGLRIFHSNKKNINYFLYRKEYLDYAETLLAKVGKNGRSVKSIGSKVMLKTELYRNDFVAKEKTIKNGINMLPAEFKIFHSNKDDQTYLLMKDRVGQLRFYRKTAENQDRSNVSGRSSHQPEVAAGLKGRAKTDMQG